MSRLGVAVTFRCPDCGGESEGTMPAGVAELGDVIEQRHLPGGCEIAGRETVVAGKTVVEAVDIDPYVYEVITGFEYPGDYSATPAHRTEVHGPTCATCDGGGCPDCTDPA